MKTLQDHMIKESGEERKYRFLPEMCCNHPLQLGALTSESFSERFISVASLLVDAHRLRLNDEMIDEIIASHMSKKFIDRIRSKNAISVTQFEKSSLTRRNNCDLLPFFCFSYFYCYLLLLFYSNLVI